MSRSRTDRLNAKDLPDAVAVARMTLLPPENPTVPMGLIDHNYCEVGKEPLPKVMIRQVFM